MGNYLSPGSRTINNSVDEIICTETTNVSDLKLCTNTTSTKVGRQASEHLDFDIFCYKQCMPLKKRQIYNWASAKLALTEKLIRTNALKQSSYIETDTDCITDDEMEEESIKYQLRLLETYRNKLMEFIGHLSLSNRSKSEKRKKAKCLSRQNMLSKKEYNQNVKSNNKADSVMTNSLKLGINLNRGGLVRKSSFKIKIIK